MGIEDFGFRRYEGGRTPRLRRTLAIARSDIGHFFKSKKMLLFYLLCLAPAVMAFVFVYIRFIVAEGQGRIGGFEMPQHGMRRIFGMVDKPEFYVDFAKGGTTLLTILFSAVVGAGVISRDRRAGALELYFTRGIQPWHYAAGKFLGIFFLLLCQVLFPFIAVWIFGVATASGESAFLQRTLGFMPRVVVAQTFLCATLALWLTSLSASTDSTRFALLRWAGGLFLLMAAGEILWRLFEQPDWRVVSPWYVVRRIAFGIADVSDWTGFHLSAAFVAWLVMTGAALLWLRRHLRPVEVVG